MKFLITLGIWRLIDSDLATVAAEYIQIHSKNAMAGDNTEETNDSLTVLFLLLERAM